MITNFFKSVKFEDLVYPEFSLIVDSGPSYQKYYKAACEYIDVLAVATVGRSSFKDLIARKAAQDVATFWIKYDKKSK